MISLFTLFKKLLPSKGHGIWTKLILILVFPLKFLFIFCIVMQCCSFAYLGARQKLKSSKTYTQPWLPRLKIHHILLAVSLKGPIHLNNHGFPVSSDSRKPTNLVVCYTWAILVLWVDSGKSIKNTWNLVWNEYIPLKYILLPALSAWCLSKMSESFHISFLQILICLMKADKM